MPPPGPIYPVLASRTPVLDHSILSAMRPSYQHATSSETRRRTRRTGMGGVPRAYRGGSGLPFGPAQCPFEFHRFNHHRERRAGDFELIPDLSGAPPIHNLQRQEFAAIRRSQRDLLRSSWRLESPRGYDDDNDDGRGVYDGCRGGRLGRFRLHDHQQPSQRRRRA